MYPRIGPLPGFAVGWIIATVLGGGWLVWRMRRAGLAPMHVAALYVTFTTALFVGSKLLYLAEAWSQGSLDAGGLRAMADERLRIPGGVLLAVLAGPPLARLIKKPYLWMADAVVPAAGLALAGIRLGCFLQGCCYGTPSSLPWAVRYAPGSDAYWWQMEHGVIPVGAAAMLPVHPLPLYFALAGLILFAVLSTYESRKRYDGEILLLFLLAYAWSTWALELLRARPHDFTHGLVFTTGLAAVALLAVCERHVRNGRLRPAADGTGDDRLAERAASD